MAGLQSPCFMALGQQGSGKSSYLREVATHYKEVIQPPFFVVINTTPEFKEFCSHHERFDLERLEKGYTAAQFEKLIRIRKSVHFEIPDYGKDMIPVLDALFRALMNLGVFDADGCTCFVLIDECHVFLAKDVFSRQSKLYCTESRKFGLHTALATQQLASSSQYTIHKMALNMVNVWAIFPTTEVNNRKRVEETLQGTIPNPAFLAMPDPEKGWGPEYLIFDKLHNKRGKVTRLPDGSRIFQEIDNYGNAA
ncbi:DEAD/DEAH box helicase family protein [Deinococcus misasensis]|uniref:DEAD/DEAH box helicase family protein n=1 Tax=Deinococcus misasensis TaxID=392413 RepID=UPI0005511AEC|nr:DEAD/DEAH box helicase family protein [Deinococcus misasensis]